MRTPADCQSATWQVTNLRYGRTLLREKILPQVRDFKLLQCKATNGTIS